MNRVKSVRTAAAVSLVLVGLWFLITVVCYIYQPDLLGLYFYGPLQQKRVILFTSVAEMVAVLVIAAAAVMLYRGKGRYSPLVMTAVTAGVSPAVRFAVTYIQIGLAAYDGVDVLAAYSAFNDFMSGLGVLITACEIIVIAAGAVNVYAKNRESAAGYQDEALYK